jgi:hypothetical protein
VKWLSRKPKPAPRPGLDPTSIGSVLLRHGFITRADLEAAVQRKLTSTPDALLGEVLIAMGACTRIQIERAVTAQQELRKERVDYTDAGRKLLSLTHERLESINVQLDNVIDAARVQIRKKD